MGTPTIAILADIPAKDMDGLQEATVPALNDVHSKEPGNLMYCLGRNDKDNKFRIGDKVEIMEAVPFSKTKKFEVIY